MNSSRPSEMRTGRARPHILGTPLKKQSMPVTSAGVPAEVRSSAEGEEDEEQHRGPKRPVRAAAC